LTKSTALLCAIGDAHRPGHRARASFLFCPLEQGTKNKSSIAILVTATSCPKVDRGNCSIVHVAKNRSRWHLDIYHTINPDRLLTYHLKGIVTSISYTALTIHEAQLHISTSHSDHEHAVPPLPHNYFFWETPFFRLLEISHPEHDLSGPIMPVFWRFGTVGRGRRVFGGRTIWTSYRSGRCQP
jgi:hypothetical protein